MGRGQPVPTFQAAGIPRSTPTLQPVDVSSVIDTLTNWQEESQRRYLKQAVADAGTEGALAGAQTPVGQPLPVYREDTLAGAAANAGARTAYLARIRLDADAEASRLAQEWDKGTYGDDIAKWEQDTQKSRGALMAGLDAKTAALYGPDIDAVYQRTRQTVAVDKLQRDKQRNHGAALVALRQYKDDMKAAAAAQDVDAWKRASGLYTTLLDSGVNERLFSAEEAAKDKMRFLDEADDEMTFQATVKAPDPLAAFDRLQQDAKLPEDRRAAISKRVQAYYSDQQWAEHNRDLEAERVRKERVRGTREALGAMILQGESVTDTSLGQLLEKDEIDAEGVSWVRGLRENVKKGPEMSNPDHYAGLLIQIARGRRTPEEVAASGYELSLADRKSLVEKATEFETHKKDESFQAGLRLIDSAFSTTGGALGKLDLDRINREHSAALSDYLTQKAANPAAGLPEAQKLVGTFGRSAADLLEGTIDFDPKDLNLSREELWVKTWKARGMPKEGTAEYQRAIERFGQVEEARKKLLELRRERGSSSK